MKRVIFVINILLLLLSACGKNEETVGLFIYDEDDLFMKSLTEDLQNEADGRLNLATFYSLNSQIIQNEQIENSIDSGSSLLIVNPVDRVGAHAVIRKLESEGIPVIFFNREPLKDDLLQWDMAWYVGARPEQSGRMQARLVMELFGENPFLLNKFDRNGDGRIQTVILKGEQGHQDAEIRTSTVLAAFQEQHYEIDLLATEVANWSRREAYDKMGELLDILVSPPELVLSNNDAMAIGAISVMRQNGIFKDTNDNGVVDKNDEQWIPVIGIDGVPDAVDQIRDGYLYGTVLNDSATMAKAIIALAEQIRSGVVHENFPYPITDGKYIWIDYKTFKLE